ncbi:MAG: hypothetical protein D6800_03785 [Candidatus Zixiibacteriota bacterium]|nr:MAG: hypothetical protein D6800_03785 [candidate division Zixibacteria bacterium]
MKRTLFSNAMANVVQMVVGTALLLFLYRYINLELGTAALGIWSVVLAMSSASRLADFGISASVTRFVARYLALDEGKDAAKVVETALLTLLVFLVVALPLLYVPLKWILDHVFSGSNLKQAQALLPFALVSLGLAILSAVVQSGLNGIQRMDLRAGLVLAAQLIFVILAFRLIPSLGLIGLAWAQIVQGAVSLFGGWLLLGRHMIALPRLPIVWSRKHFREMLGYGVNVQAATLLVLALDPLTKALMARFGGAETAGFFEMANQIAIKVRTLIMAANQAIVPKVAQMKEKSPHLLTELSNNNYKIIFYLSPIILSLLYLSSGVLSIVLIGHIAHEFILILFILLAAWFINVFTGPAYFINLGIGRPGRNTISHAVMACVNLLLGWSFGAMFGGTGVAFAYAVALVAGSAILIIDHLRRSGTPFHRSMLKGHEFLLAITLLSITGGIWIWNTTMFLSDFDRIVLSIALTFGVLLAAWLDPYRKLLIGMMKGR